MFKVGDRVVCIDNRLAEGIITLGETYTVSSVDTLCGTCTLYGISRVEWFLDRFQLVSDLDPLVEIRQSEYSALIEEVNLLQDLLAEANAVNIKPEFKSVRDYTIEDWKQALDEEWVFECRDGSLVRIAEINVNAHDDRPVYGYYHHLDGVWDYYYGNEDECDIMKRIK